MSDSRLPYFVPDKDYYLNLGIVLLILYSLSETKSGKATLNNEKIQYFFYLLGKPVYLNRLLESFNKKQVDLNDIDFYTIDSLSNNLDPLSDRDRLKDILRALACYGYLTTKYHKSDGFMYLLTDKGKSVATKLTDGHFSQVRKYLDSLQAVQSQPASKIAANLNGLFKQYV